MAILENSRRSLLLQLLCNDQPLGTGTGFIVISKKGPVLITNRHIATGRHNITGQPMSPSGGIPNKVQIAHNCLGKPEEWVLRTELLLKDDSPQWIEHPTLGALADFVALPLTQLNDVKLFPYSLIQVGHAVIKIAPAEVVSVVGFPFGKTGGGSLAIWATGFIATEPDIDFEGQPKFLIDCRTRPGQSGSVVIAHRNGGSVTLENERHVVSSRPMTRFLGIYSGRINDQSDLGIVWKASSINELVESI
ncbi:MAG: trypsin-like peptidase domain-containing protein [Ignavibacteriales bacterium]|nr:trypsin-like peptidase domain-containing protein [Ignavibacteriales bacterium]